MINLFAPPEEEIVRAITSAHWDEKNNRWSKSIFYSHNVSVSRLAITPLVDLILLFKGNFPTLLKVGQINVGELNRIGIEHDAKTDIKVKITPRTDNPAHAEIPGKLSKALARKVTDKLEFHDI